MTSMPQKRFLNVREFAAHIGKSENSIRYHIKVGRIPAIKLGTSLLIDPEEAIRKLKRH